MYFLVIVLDGVSSVCMWWLSFCVLFSIFGF